MTTKAQLEEEIEVLKEQLSSYRMIYEREQTSQDQVVKKLTHAHEVELNGVKAMHAKEISDAEVIAEKNPKQIPKYEKRIKKLTEELKYMRGRQAVLLNELSESHGYIKAIDKQLDRQKTPADRRQSFHRTAQ